MTSFSDEIALKDVFSNSNAHRILVWDDKSYSQSHVVKSRIWRYLCSSLGWVPAFLDRLHGAWYHQRYENRCRCGEESLHFGVQPGWGMKQELHSWWSQHWDQTWSWFAWSRGIDNEIQSDYKYALTSSKKCRASRGPWKIRRPWGVPEADRFWEHKKFLINQEPDLSGKLEKVHRHEIMWVVCYSNNYMSNHRILRGHLMIRLESLDPSNFFTLN